MLLPRPGAALGWEEEGGQVVLEWQSPSGTHWIQYRIGQGFQQVKGSFLAEQRRLVFGPFPQGFWNDLATYNPFRFRVVDAEGRSRSAWIGFEVVAEQ